MFVRLCLDDCKNRLNRLCGFISQFFFFFLQGTGCFQGLMVMTYWVSGRRI